MKVTKSKALISGVAVLTLALTACGSSGGGKSSKSGSSGSSSSTTTKTTGQLTFGESTDFPENLQFLIAPGNSVFVGDLQAPIIQSGYKILPSIKFAVDPNQLAGTPTNTIVNGQQVVTAKLNPKAVWADGTPITAADYVFYINSQKSLDPKTGGCAALLSTTGFDQVQTADAVDDHTVKITFKKGQDFPDWPTLLAPMPKHIMDKGSAKANCAYITAGWPLKTGIPLGAQNGPYVLQPKNIDVSAKTFTLTPNPKWWGTTKPKLARIVDAFVGSDSDTNVKALRNQEVNMVNPQPQLDLVANLKQLTDVTTDIQFGLDYEHLDFNTKDPLLKNIAVRQAIAYGIDRPSLVAATVGKFSDKATPLGNHLLVTNQPGYVDNGAEFAKQNVAKAKSLLASAGGKMGANGIMAINGKPLAFTIETTQQNPLRDQTIQTIASQLKPLGIKITEDADADIFGDASKPHSLVAEGFQIALFAWSGSPSIASGKSIYQAPVNGAVGQNYSQGGTPAIDAALNKMSSSASNADEVKYANEADALLWKQMYTLPLYQKPQLLAYTQGFTGIQANATQAGPLWNSEDIAVKN